MTDEQIFLKALEIVDAKGFDIGWEDPNIRKARPQHILDNTTHYERLGIIFSQQFSELFWGNKGTGIQMTCLCLGDCGHNMELMEWMPEVQQMVISENPFKYLKKKFDE